MGYETTSELRTLLQQEVNDSAPDAATLTRYLNLLDMSHKAIIAGGRELNLDDTGHPVRRPFLFPFALAIRPKIINLVAPVNDTASVTKSNASVTITTNSAVTNLTGYNIRFGDGRTVYYVTLHSGTTLTLDSVYLEETNASISAVVFKLIYTVGSDDIMLPADRMRAFKQIIQQDYAISFVDAGELLDKYPLTRTIQGEPELAAVLRHLNGTMTIQLSHYPDDIRKLELAYVPVPADLDLVGSDPILPAHHRTVLVHLAAYYHLRKRDDDRANSHLSTARQLFDALTTEAQQVVNANDDRYGYIAPWSNGVGRGIKSLVSIDV